jgi:hypothetical protein
MKKHDVERYRGRFYGKLEEIRKEVCEKSIEEESISDLENRNNRKIAFYGLYDIVHGEYYVRGRNILSINASFDIDETFLDHPKEDYWTKETLAAEYFAVIGSLRTTIPEAFKEIIAYLPNSYKVYNEIIEYILESTGGSK